VVGTVLVLLVVRLARQLVPDRPAIGWIAGFTAAVFPTHVYMVTHFQVAVWAATFLVATLLIATSQWAEKSWLGPIVAGLLGGGMLLIDPILALPLAVCATALFIGRSSPQTARNISQMDSGNIWGGKSCNSPLGISLLRRALRAGTMLAVAAVVITPWTIRNWRVHGELVFVKSTFWYAFWQGNNPASWGTDKVPKPAVEQIRRRHDGTLAGMNQALWEARHATVYIDDVVLKPTGYAEFAGLSEPERCRLLKRRALRFVGEHPGRYLKLCLRRLRYWLLYDETNPKAAHWLYRLSSIVWLLLGAAGVVLSTGYWRTLWPAYAIFILLTVFHSMVIVSARFRIPVEPLGLIWMAFPIALVVRAVAGRDFDHTRNPRAS